MQNPHGFFFVLKIKTKGNNDVIDLTEAVEQNVKSSDIKNGMCHIFAKGSTVGVTTIENEPNLVKDFKNAIERLIPKGEYLHNSTWGDGNGHSHIRSSIIKTDLSVPILNGELFLGTWQQIVLVDFDTRPREREVAIVLEKFE